MTDERSGARGKSRAAQVRPAIIILTLIAFVLVCNQIFLLRIAGFQLVATGYFYALIGFFIAMVFLVFPARKNSDDRLPWYDIVCAALTLVIGLYFASNAEQSIARGWDFEAPFLPTAAAVVMLLLVLEALRRTGGLVLLFMCLFFAAYPIFADSMPGILWGVQTSVLETVRSHVMGIGSIVGIPIRVVSNLVIGYLLFGATLAATGGSTFFMDFAGALMGRTRGGPAKVSIVASGFFGSLSGSVISNVISTGSFTIPTMRRCGYPPTYAAAVEACASTGGSIMPPVMGAAAFIMATFLNIPYANVVAAAAIPAVLFYVTLLLQVDAYAARNNLQGLPEESVPSMRATMRAGWHHLAGLILMVVLILFFHMERTAPFVSAGFILFVTVVKSPKATLGTFADVLVETGKSSAYLYGILAGVGLIVGGLSFTGVGSSVSRELLQYAGDSVALLLVFGAITSFVLGMGMTASACYIFLAIIMGPALVAQGLDPLASHLFILYWGMLSYITPPVALAAVSASVIAESDAFKTGVKAMRIGAVLFLLPFAFVINPALIGQGAVVDVVLAVSTALLAIWLVSCAFERYMHWVGPLSQVPRLAIGVAGLLLLMPETMTDIIGFCLMIAGVVLSRFLKPDTLGVSTS